MEPLDVPSRCLRVFKPRRLLLSPPIHGRRLPAAHTRWFPRPPFIPKAPPKSLLAGPLRLAVVTSRTLSPPPRWYWWSDGTPPTPQQPQATPTLRPHPFSTPGRHTCGLRPGYGTPLAFGPCRAAVVGTRGIGGKMPSIPAGSQPQSLNISSQFHAVSCSFIDRRPPGAFAGDLTLAPLSRVIDRKVP